MKVYDIVRRDNDNLIPNVDTGELIIFSVKGELHEGYWDGQGLFFDNENNKRFTEDEVDDVIVL